MRKGVPWLLAVLLTAVGMTALLLVVAGPVQADPQGATAPSEAQSAVHPLGPGVQTGVAMRPVARQPAESLPLRFVANVGQDDPAVRFSVKGAGHTLYFTTGGLVFSAVEKTGGEPVRSVVRLRFLGADPQPGIEGLKPMRGVVNHFLGNDPAGWRANVPTYGAVAYRNLYPGISLIYRGTEGHLKSEFLLGPEADPAVIQMIYEGAESLRLRDDGALLIRTALGELIEGAPLIYQEVNGVRRAIPGGFVLHREDRVGFWVGAHNPAYPLVIDPALAYSSYLGGSGDDQPWHLILDDAGNIYLAGQTTSGNFPTHDPLDPDLGGSMDAFVTQIVNAGGVYTYGHSTYLGGSGDDIGWGVGVDGAGDVYLAGQTYSSNFPTYEALDATLGGSQDVFLSKISDVGGVYTLTFSTYLGGSGDDGWCTNLAVDDAGNAYLAGSTWSSDFPTHMPLDANLSDLHDAFVTKIIRASGVYTYAFSTYWGGSSYELGYGIDVDDSGNIYVAGDTWSSDFPTRNPTQPTYGGTPTPIYGGDAFVTKFINTGSGYDYIFSTFLGGSASDEGTRIAADSAGSIFVTGRVFSTDFPSHHAIRAACNAGHPTYDAYVTSYISATGAYTYAYSTYLCGAGNDYGQDVDVDSLGNVYATGATASSDFPVTDDAIEATHQGSLDAYVTQIISAGGVYTYAYSTYLGGSGSDLARTIALDSADNIYLSGETASSDYPTTTNALQPAHGGGSYDAFVSVIAPVANLAISKSVTPGLVAPGQVMTYTLVYTNDGSAVVAGVRISDMVPLTLTSVAFDSTGARVTLVGDLRYTWDVAPLSPGAGGVITITGVVSPDVGGLFTLTNEAVITTVEGYYWDQDLANNVSAVSNVVDDVPPLGPTLVSPADGTVLTDTTPTLTWQASPSADVAGYLLDLSGTVMDLGDVTAYTTALLGPGQYTWKVAAYDAALNGSPFTNAWSFTIEEEQIHIYLPLVVRDHS